jgi:hypothetical protein
VKEEKTYTTVHHGVLVITLLLGTADALKLDKDAKIAYFGL